MNSIFKFAFALVALLAMVSCSEKISDSDFLNVTPNNISGSWRLESSCGEPLAEGLYVYIDFDRKERSFEMFQNTDSFATRCITGRYFIYTDYEAGAVIRGDYDYGNGAWEHRYVVTDLTKSRMTWTALDNEEFVNVYVRCEIPELIRAASTK